MAEPEQLANDEQELEQVATDVVNFIEGAALNGWVSDFLLMLERGQIARARRYLHKNYVDDNYDDDDDDTDDETADSQHRDLAQQAYNGLRRIQRGDRCMRLYDRVNAILIARRQASTDEFVEALEGEIGPSNSRDASDDISSLTVSDPTDKSA